MSLPPSPNAVRLLGDCGCCLGGMADGETKLAAGAGTTSTAPTATLRRKGKADDGKSSQLLVELGVRDGGNNAAALAQLRKDARLDGLSQRQVQVRTSTGSRAAFAGQLAESGRELIFAGLQSGSATSASATSPSGGGAGGASSDLKAAPLKSLRAPKVPGRGGSDVQAVQWGGSGSIDVPSPSASSRLWGVNDGGNDGSPSRLPGSPAGGAGGDGVDGRPSSSHGRGSQPRSGTGVLDDTASPPSRDAAGDIDGSVVVGGAGISPSHSGAEGTGARWRTRQPPRELGNVRPMPRSGSNSGSNSDTEDGSNLWGDDGAPTSPSSFGRAVSFGRESAVRMAAGGDSGGVMGRGNGYNSGGRGRGMRPDGVAMGGGRKRNSPDVDIEQIAESKVGASAALRATQAASPLLHTFDPRYAVACVSPAMGAKVSLGVYAVVSCPIHVLLRQSHSLHARRFVFLRAVAHPRGRQRLPHGATDRGELCGGEQNLGDQRLAEPAARRSG